MWYLETQTLGILVLYVAVTALLRVTLERKKPLWFRTLLPIAELGLLALIDLRLAVFYLIYLGLSMLCNWLLYRFHHWILFLGFSLVALVPFFLTRFETFGLSLPFPLVCIGIAFQMLKQIDTLYYVYYTREKIDVLPYLNYMLFLPVFTAGPIFRYSAFLRTYNAPVPMTCQEFTLDFKRIVRGFFKKVVLVALVIRGMNLLLTFGAHWYLSILSLLLSYLELYFDLSGYSDIAIGMGRMAGYAVPENFKRPWASPSFTQFWRNWHSTLSDWIREHIFILLNKKKLKRSISALIALLTMVVMSLWHGFSWLYLIAGVYNGALLAIENLLEQTSVNKRKVKHSVYLARCLFVNAAFALNTLVFTLQYDQLLQVLHGFFKL